jgi:hypothetical protein
MPGLSVVHQEPERLRNESRGVSRCAHDSVGQPSAIKAMAMGEAAAAGLNVAV